MVNMYYNLVINKRRTCNSENTSVPLVPNKHLAEVIEMLLSNGYDIDGNYIGA